MKHAHYFSRRNSGSTVETCACGKFQHTENAGPTIPAVETPRYVSDAERADLSLLVKAESVAFRENYVLRANATIAALLEGIKQEHDDTHRLGGPCGHDICDLAARVREGK